MLILLVGVSLFLLFEHPVIFWLIFVLVATAMAVISFCLFKKMQGGGLLPPPCRVCFLFPLTLVKGRIIRVKILAVQMTPFHLNFPPTGKGGQRSGISGVNNSPVDCQSRNVTEPQRELAPPANLAPPVKYTDVGYNSPSAPTPYSSKKAPDFTRGLFYFYKRQLGCLFYSPV